MALETTTSATSADKLFPTQIIQRPSALVGTGDGLIGRNSGKGVVSLLPSQDQVTISDQGRKALSTADKAREAGGGGQGKELPSPIPTFKVTNLTLSQDDKLGVGITKLSSSDYLFKKSLQWLVDSDQRPGKLSITA